MKNMKVGFVILALAAFGLLFSGCSVSSGHIGHGIMTQVDLSQANYTVVDTVTGEASASRFIGIGLSSFDLAGRAKRDMIDQANLGQGSRAVINVTIDRELSSYIIYDTTTVYVTAEVIEFTD